MYTDLVAITTVVFIAYFWSEPVMTKRFLRIAKRTFFELKEKSQAGTAPAAAVLPAPRRKPASHQASSGPYLTPQEQRHKADLF